EKCVRTCHSFKNWLIKILHKKLDSTGRRSHALAGNICPRALLSTDGEAENNQNQKPRQDNRIIVFAL
ncbi:MAG: hypothetical protein QGH96_10040, partial [Desulfobacterales bacterium]|nr:hypothetical protein [Desulfobacterales bacterium]